MMPTVRMRLERNVEYHEAIVEQHKKLIEARNQQQSEAQPDQYQTQEQEQQQQQAQQQQAQQNEGEDKQSNAIIEMHADAAKQLRDILNTDPVVASIAQAVTDRTVVRDRGPVARTLN